MEFARIALADGADLDGFRRAARRLIADAVPPEQVVWCDGTESDLFGTAHATDAPPLSLPRKIAALIENVICHREPARYALLYTLIWRVRQGEAGLLEIATDPLVHRLHRMGKAVHRDAYKMHAFLRFRKIDDAALGERYVAWFEPEHYVLERAAPFFIDRFRSLAWSILTPLGSLHWDRENLVVGPAAQRQDAPAADALEAVWRGYYESVFNPARVNPAAMRTQMPKKFWHNMPETAAISGLIRAAQARESGMIAREATAPRKRNPDKAVAAMAEQEPQSLEALNRLIAALEPLSPGADRAVLGEGPIGPAIALVGEQPGDQEEREGRPFIGPAGRLLDDMLGEIGIDRRRVYITNAVKHFKFTPRGQRRIHDKPTTAEIKRYRWWLMKELAFVRPRFVVALGATAGLALHGRAVSVLRERGAQRFGDYAGYLTIHPSYLLRLSDARATQQARADFRADLERIRELTAT
jgi:uracil-DNA glycosylase